MTSNEHDYQELVNDLYGIMNDNTRPPTDVIMLLTRFITIKSAFQIFQMTFCPSLE